MKARSPTAVVLFLLLLFFFQKPSRIMKYGVVRKFLVCLFLGDQHLVSTKLAESNALSMTRGGSCFEIPANAKPLNIT